MKASATRSKSSETSLMGPAAGKIAEYMIAIMQMYGIRRIECKKLRLADFERVIADVSMFEEATTEITNAGYLVKDAIAEILASAGVVAVEITKEDKDSEMLKKSYATLIERRDSKLKEASEAKKDGAEAKAEDTAKEPEKKNLNKSEASKGSENAEKEPEAK